MTGIPLFIAEPTGTCRLALRRYRGRNEPSDHLHDATVIIDENARATPPKPDGTRQITDKRIPRDDPRSQATCPCGEPFTETDQWQVNEQEWYEGGGRRFAWGTGSWDGPPGALIRSLWRDEPGRPPSWVVFLPNSTWWNTNDPSTPGDGTVGRKWDVSGEAPRLTVNPSINDQGSRPWHGWIRDGVLERMTTKTHRVAALTTIELYHLDVACRVISHAFRGGPPYLVGSAGVGTDGTYRDVDVRLMLDDDEFAEVCPTRARWELLCLSIGTYLAERTGLPIDFQIQRTADANERFDGPRNPLGMSRTFAGGGDGTPNWDGSAAP